MVLDVDNTSGTTMVPDADITNEQETGETMLLPVLLPLMLSIVVIGCIVYWMYRKKGCIVCVLIHRRKGSRRKNDVEDHVEDSRTKISATSLNLVEGSRTTIENM